MLIGEHEERLSRISQNKSFNTHLKVCFLKGIEVLNREARDSNFIFTIMAGCLFL